MSDLLERVTAFRTAFARRQAAETVELPGAVALRDPGFALSQEHNQLLVTSAEADPAALPELAVRGLGERRGYRITVLDEAFARRAAPVLAAAGYDCDIELVMARETAAAVRPDPAARPVAFDELREPLLAQQLRWFTDREVARQLAERRTARLRGADQVLFLASRTAGGEIAGWADLYLDPAAGLAQLEDLVTAEPHRGQGHGETLLATGLALAAGAGIPELFLNAADDDWPKEWYASRGFRLIGRNYTFLRRA
jgi:N-acetylglutamate synthase-like GNAT family acetyltransferase